jgi:MFS family permease
MGSGSQRASTSPRSAVRKLAFSRGVTYAGGNAAFWALSAILYQQTQSVTLVAAAALASFSVPAAVSPVAGFLGDRFDRRCVMVSSELAGAICFLGLAFASESPIALLGLRILASILWAPLEPATNAALPSLVREDALEDANAAISKAGIAGCLIGSAVAGVMLATLGGASVFLLNSATFLISAAVIYSIRGDFRPQITHHDRIAAGFAFLRRHAILRPVTIAYGVTFIGIGVSIPAEIVVADEFGAGSLGYAAMFTLWGVGGLIGATAGNRLKLRPRKVKMIAAASLAIAAGFAAVSAAPYFAIALLGMTFGGIGEGLWEVTQTSLIQRVAPDGIRGRVFAASTAAMQASIAIGLLLSGVVTAVAGASGAFAVAAAAAAGAGTILLLQGVPAEERGQRETPAMETESAMPPSGSPPIEVARTAA